MTTLNQIGLNRDKSEELSVLLNNLLANYQLYYQNLRAFHWNIKGKDFFELHTKFEELYLDSQEKIDLIAERIRTLGFVPYHRFSDYLMHATIMEADDTDKGHKNVSNSLSAIRILLIQEREALELASEINDEGSLSMLSDFITEQEKTVWMLGAYLNS